MRHIPAQSSRQPRTSSISPRWATLRRSLARRGRCTRRDPTVLQLLIPDQLADMNVFFDLMGLYVCTLQDARSRFHFGPVLLLLLKVLLFLLFRLRTLLLLLTQTTFLTTSIYFNGKPPLLFVIFLSFTINATNGRLICRHFTRFRCVADCPVRMLGLRMRITGVLRFTGSCKEQGGATSRRKTAQNTMKLPVRETFWNGGSLSTVKVCYRQFRSKQHVSLVINRALVFVCHYPARYWVHLVLAIFKFMNLLWNTRVRATSRS